MSCDAAAALWELDGVTASAMHVLVTKPRHLRSQKVVVHRVANVIPADMANLGPIRLTSPLRTVIDLAAVVSEDVLEVAIESALRRRLFSVGQLRWRADALTGRGRTGSLPLRRLLAGRALGQSESRPEVELARLLVEEGFPEPERQYRVIVGGRLIARVDLAYPVLRVALEYDSDAWHSGVRPRHGDAQRRNLLRAAGWAVIEVTPADLRDPASLLELVRTLLRAS